jgi:hypothetical protein
LPYLAYAPEGPKGRLEYWNGGIMGEKNENKRSVSSAFYFPLFHYSIILTFHVDSIIRS